jgi:PAS domain S-box-containing protein
MEKAQILVVEDETIVAMDLQNRLRGLGHSVPGFWVSGEEAIAMAEELKPDLILMDIKLGGGMDGIEAAYQIRHRFEVPVIYLTANSDETTVQRAKFTEPYGYLLKPFAERELETAIEIALYRHRTEQKLRRSDAMKKAILESALDCIITIDHEGRIVDFNPAAERVFGYARDSAIGELMADLIIPPSLRTRHWQAMSNHLLTGESTVLNRRLEMNAMRADGTEFPVELAISRMEVDGRPLFAGYLRDITERKRSEQEMAKLVGGLQDALANVKTLTGMLPICARCKKIRDDHGYWNQVEQYIMNRSDATFTHGCCPDCIKYILDDSLADD